LAQVEKIQQILEAKTRRWWFFVGVIGLSYILLPFASKNFSIFQFMDILRTTLGNSFYNSFKPVFVVFQVIAIAMFILLILFRQKMSQIFCIYTAACYVLFNIQNIAATEKYGLSIVTYNIFAFNLVAVSWGWEVVAGKNDFSQIRQPFWKYIILAFAVFAFWLPISPQTGGPDFKLTYFLTSGSALAFCMMTPVFIAILIFFYPAVNFVTLRVTGLIGTAIGLVNVIPKLILRMYSTWWDGFLHLPLLALSIIGMVLSMKTIPNKET
jgi:hypothetical protein